MSGREGPSVADAIALGDFGGGVLQTPGAVDRHDDDIVRLLQDIIAIFRQRDADRLPTSVLIDGLLAVEGQNWSGEYLRDAQKLARLLRALHIRSRTIRFEHGPAKGYQRRCFEDALKLFSPCDGARG